jgi:hypothetical protein
VKAHALEADVVKDAVANRCLVLCDLDEGGALRATLADLPALDVAREHDVRCLVAHGVLMHVTERPVVIPARNQFS